MKASPKTLLLNGSPKPGASTSESLLTYLGETLEQLGVSTQSVKLIKAVRSEERTAELLAAIDGSDLVVLSFPLYWDSLPGHVVRACELIARHRGASRAGARPTAPRAPPSRPSSRAASRRLSRTPWRSVCRNFARTADLEWAEASRSAAAA